MILFIDYITRGIINSNKIKNIKSVSILKLKDKISYIPIGIIHSPFKQAKGTPIQATAAKDVEGLVEIFPKYLKGLKDIEGFSHIILIYHFHLSKSFTLVVKPFMDNKFHGIFATRAPARPNPIGISIVRLIKVKENKLYIKDVDIVDGTPLLDIKPFVAEFDIRNVIKNGWLKRNVKKLEKSKDDGRFILLPSSLVNNTFNL